MAENGLNRATLLGRLGADPELRVTPGGQSILKMRLATTESYLDRNNARQERTEWHSVSLWGRRGEALAKFLRKGARLFIEGRIQTSSYEKDGEKKYRTEIVASNVILCGGKRGESGGDAADGSEEHAPRGGHERSRSDSGSGGVPSAPPIPAEDFGDYAGGADDDDGIPF